MKAFRRLLHPLAAISALALAVAAQPVAANASPTNSNAATSSSAANSATSSGKGPQSPSSGKGTQSPSASPSASASKGPQGNVPKGLENFYKQKVAWSACTKNDVKMKCADVKVPLDYKKPGGKTITIAMAKLPAKSGKPIGTLFVNPGGPGGSGIDLASVASDTFGAKVVEKYDIVGFDPRGVGESTAVDCLSDAELGKFLDSDFDMSTEAGRKAMKAQTQKLVDGCKKKSGELLAHVGTESTARDLDVLRGLVGDEKLNYLGFSYGTELGGAYGNIFPKKVGKMVLDGAVNPQLGGARSSYDQTIGQEKSFEHYAERCAKSGNCSLGSSAGAAKKKLLSLIAQASRKPFPTSDPNRPLNGTMLLSVVSNFMYDDAQWPQLNQAIEQLVKQNDGSLALQYFDTGNEREGNKFKSNLVEANIAINCADYPVDSKSEYEKYAKKLKDEAPLFGGNGEVRTDSCATWPYHPKAKPSPYRAKGSAPIVVIGTKNDPATPYSWAQNMHKTLENSVLLTWEGEGHTAYGRAGSCIDTPVDEYLLTGKVPKDGLTCQVEKTQQQKAGKQRKDSVIKFADPLAPLSPR